MHQTQVGVDEVVIQNALRHHPRYEAGPFVSVGELEGRAGFHDAPNADKPFLDRARKAG